MNVDKVNNNKLVVAGTFATLATGAASATVGYNRSLFGKNSTPNDEFVSHVANSLKQSDDAELKKISKLMSEITVEKPLNEFAIDKLNGRQLTNSNGEATEFLKQVQKEYPKYTKGIRDNLQKLLVENASMFDIVPKEGQTVEKAVSSFMRKKENIAIAKYMSDTLAESASMIYSADYKEGAKEYIKLAYDTSKKDFRVPTQDVPKTAIEYIKKSMRDVKLAHAVKYGIVGTATAAVVALGGSLIAKSSKK